MSVDSHGTGAPSDNEARRGSMPGIARPTLAEVVDRPDMNSSEGSEGTEADHWNEIDEEEEEVESEPEPVWELGKDCDEFDSADWHYTVMDLLDKLKVDAEWEGMSELRRRFLLTEPRRHDDMDKLQALSTQRAVEAESITHASASVAMDIEDTMSKLLIRLDGFGSSLRKSRASVRQHRVSVRQQFSGGISFDGIVDHKPRGNAMSFLDTFDDMRNSDVNVEDRHLYMQGPNSKAGVLLGVVSQQQTDITSESVTAEMLSRQLSNLRETLAFLESGEKSGNAKQEVKDTIQSFANQIRDKRQLEHKRVEAKMLAELAANGGAGPEGAKDINQEVLELKAHIRSLEKDMQTKAGSPPPDRSPRRKSRLRRMAAKEDSAIPTPSRRRGALTGGEAGAFSSGAQPPRSSRLLVTKSPVPPRPPEALQEVRRQSAQLDELQTVVSEMRREKAAFQQGLVEARELRHRWAVVATLEPLPGVGIEPAGFALAPNRQNEADAAMAAARRASRAVKGARTKEWHQCEARMEEELGTPAPQSLQELASWQARLGQELREQEGLRQALLQKSAELAASRERLSEAPPPRGSRRPQAPRQPPPMAAPTPEPAAPAHPSACSAEQDLAPASPKKLVGPVVPDGTEHLDIARGRRAAFKHIVNKSSMMTWLMRDVGKAVGGDGKSVSPRRRSSCSPKAEDVDGDEPAQADAAKVSRKSDELYEEDPPALISRVQALQAELEAMHGQQFDYETATFYLRKAGSLSDLTEAQRALVMSLVDGRSSLPDTPRLPLLERWRSRVLSLRLSGASARSSGNVARFKEVVLHRRLQSLRQKWREMHGAKKPEQKASASVPASPKVLSPRVLEDGLPQASTLSEATMTMSITSPRRISLTTPSAPVTVFRSPSSQSLRRVQSVNNAGSQKGRRQRQLINVPDGPFIERARTMPAASHTSSARSAAARSEASLTTELAAASPSSPRALGGHAGPGARRMSAGSYASSDLQVLSTSYISPVLRAESGPRARKSRTLPAASHAGPEPQAESPDGRVTRRSSVFGTAQKALREGEGAAAKARAKPRRQFAHVQAALGAGNWKRLGTAEPGAAAPLASLAARRISQRRTVPD